MNFVVGGDSYIESILSEVVERFNANVKAVFFSFRTKHVFTTYKHPQDF